jgi:hypothetical protein
VRDDRVRQLLSNAHHCLHSITGEICISLPRLVSGRKVSWRILRRVDFLHGTPLFLLFSLSLIYMSVVVYDASFPNHGPPRPCILAFPRSWHPPPVPQCYSSYALSPQRNHQLLFLLFPHGPNGARFQTSKADDQVAILS